MDNSGIELLTLSNMVSNRFVTHIEFGDSAQSKAPKSIIIEDQKKNQVKYYIKSDENVENAMSRLRNDFNIQGSFSLHNMNNKMLKSKSILSSRICGSEITMSRIRISAEEEDMENFEVDLKQTEQSIYLRIYVFDRQEVLVVEIQRCKTTEQLKEIIEIETKHKANDQILRFGGATLNDHATLKSYEIGNNDEIHMSLVQYVKSKNYSVISSGIAADSMQIIVKNIKQNVRKIFNVKPSTKFSQLKQMIEQQWQILPIYQKLRYASTLLADNQSFSDYGIPKRSEISLLQVNIQGFSAKSEVVAEGEVGIAINKIICDTNLMSHRFDNNSKKVITVNKNEKFQRNKFITIKTQNSIIQCSEDFYFFTDQKTWKCSDNQNIDSLVVGDAIMTYKGSFQKILHKERSFIRRPTDFYHLQTTERDNYFVNNFLVQPALKINVILSKQGNNQKQGSRTVVLNKRATVFELKEKVLHLNKIQKSKKEIQQLKVFVEETLLQDKKTLSEIEQDINLERSTFTLLENRGQILKRIVMSKTITLQDENEKVHVKYNHIKNLIVRNIISENIKHSRSQYCLIYNNKILMPYERIDSIEANEHFIEENITLIVFKCSEKFIVSRFFNEEVEYLCDETQFTDNVKEKLVKIRQQPIPGVTNPSQKRALEHYLCDVFKAETDQFLATMHSLQPAEIVQKRQYKYLNNLFRALQTLKNYYGVCYRVLPNFHLSDHNKVGDVFTWRSIVSTSTSLEQTKKKIDEIKRNGTLFHILSTTGKDLNLFNDRKENQIVFSPYSYFVIQKIEKKEKFQEVWLIEIASPIYFKKNLILWVDDNPQNNIVEMQIIAKPELEVIQLRSTVALMQWMKQFGWVMTWKGINMRIISDMVRKEGKADNYYAGIDLLQIAFNQAGLTTPIIIFCGQAGRARKNVNERGIRKDRVYRVTSDPIEIYAYAEFNQLA